MKRMTRRKKKTTAPAAGQGVDAAVEEVAVDEVAAEEAVEIDPQAAAELAAAQALAAAEDFTPCASALEAAALDAIGVLANCIHFDLPIDGGVDPARQGLLGKLRGGDTGHVHGATLCPMCRKPARVQSVNETKRYYRCDCCGCRFGRPR